jgi:tyrosyl-tRNA synthetase
VAVLRRGVGVGVRPPAVGAFPQQPGGSVTGDHPGGATRAIAAELAARSVNCEPSVDELARKLELGRPLRVKLGVDPTAPDIHLGHCVVLGKLREFQDRGHIAVLVIGDWTARVGDPSGRSSTRPMLSQEEIIANAETFREQAYHVLDPARTEVRANGEWFADMGLAPLFELASRATINQLLRRNDFAMRMQEDRPVSVLELLYPLLQGYDSVALAADVELGGTDQLFNLMLARDIQARYGVPQQVAITMPILAGTDGVQKMSKSLGNYIAVADAPDDQFGKVMSIPDAVMSEYFRLLFPGVPPPDGHPATEKRRLGRLVVSRFHSAAAADAAEAHFNRVVRDREAPTDVPEYVLADDEIHVPALLVDALGIASRSEARRLIQQGGVATEQGPLTALDMPASALRGHILRAGKRRFVRLI